MSYKQDRLYWLPTSDTCQYNCSYCEAIGALTQFPKEREDIERRVYKARVGGYAGIVVPCNAMATDTPNYFIERSDTRILLNTNYSSNDWANAIKILNKYRNEVIILIDGPVPNLSEMISQVTQATTCTEYWLVLRRGLSVPVVLNNLTSSQRPLVRFYCPQKKLVADEYLTSSEIYELGETLTKIYPEIIFKPPSRIEPHQPYIDQNLERDPIPSSVTQVNLNSSEVTLSIIIPSYNSGTYLEQCIRHLLLQVEISPETYEIIVVDDGSNDGSASPHIFGSFTIRHPNEPGLTLVRIERPYQRNPGDASFRAGVARNVGTRYASGKFLAFIDADILVSKLFVKKYLSALEHADVVQAQRNYLTYSASQMHPSYEDINPDDCFIPDDGYWHKFYEDGKLNRWNSLDHAYKYVCSFSLAMSTQLFRDIGGFRRTFAYYGFEDTELGYRLQKNGATFHLLTELVYHLEPSPERSEYRGDEDTRNELLRHSAGWFYQLTLDKDVYQHFQGMI